MYSSSLLDKVTTSVDPSRLIALLKIQLIHLSVDRTIQILYYRRNCDCSFSYLRGRIFPDLEFPLREFFKSPADIPPLRKRVFKAAVEELAPQSLSLHKSSFSSQESNLSRLFEDFGFEPWSVEIKDFLNVVNNINASK